MLKFTSNFANTKLVLVRKHVADGSCSGIVLLRSAPQRGAQVRRYAIQERHQTATIRDCPTPPPKPKSRFFFYSFVGATLIAGSAVVYAKRSPAARNWLESNIPIANDVLAVVFQENTTYWQFSVDQFHKITTFLSHFMFGKEGVTPMEFQSRPEQDLEKDAIKAFTKTEYELPPTKFEPLYKEETVVVMEPVDAPALVVQSEKCEPAKKPQVKITKSIVDVELEMHENTKIAIDNYKNAIDHIEKYNKALFKAVEASVGELDRKLFTSLQSAGNHKESSLKKAKEASAKAKCAIDTLERMIKEGVAAPPDSIAQTQRYIRDFRKDLEKVEEEYRKQEESSTLSTKYLSKVEAARNMYREELQILFPGIDLSAPKLTLKGDTDLLLIYTMKQVQLLQNELAELQTIREQKINRAIECNDEKAIIEAKVEDMVKRDKINRELEFQKRTLATQAEANKKLKEALLKQIEIQQEVQAQALAKKEKEIMATYSRALSEALEKDRIEFKKDLAAMAGKMMAIENTLKQRAKGEAEARRSQSLWAAAEALMSAMRRPAGTEVNLANEINALEKAGAGDKLVETVVKGISNEIREKGVVTEKALRDKFDSMERSAAKVALIGRDGAGLPVYFLSWLQSKLLFQQFADIPKDELDNQPTDFSKLDTFEIIQRARYHMEHDDLPSALRYVNLLQGGARAAAIPWLEAAKRHLEVKQAAEAVMAHASVAGIIYL